MRTRRFIGTLLAAALTAGSLGLVAAGPASATTATKIVGSDGKAWLKASSYRTQPGVPKYGDSLSLSINVETSSGDQVYDGSLTVQRKVAGSSAWTTVATSSSAYLYKSIKAVGNATYRVAYSGSGDYAPSAAGVSVKIQRDLNETPQSKGNKLYLKGKVAPKYSKKKVTVQKKVGKKWKKYRSQKTDKAGKFKIRVSAPGHRGGKVKYRLYIPSCKVFAATTSQTYVATKY